MVAVFSMLAGVGLVASYVAAQSPPTCALTCATNAVAGSGCSSITDLGCLCNSEKFFDAAGTCTIQTCPPADVSAAQAALATLCKGSATTSFSLDTSTISFTGSASGGSSSTTSSIPTSAISSSSSVSGKSSSSVASGVSKTSTVSSVSGASTASQSSSVSTSSAVSVSSSSATSSASSTSTSGAAGKRAVILGGANGVMAMGVAAVGVVAGAFAMAL